MSNILALGMCPDHLRQLGSGIKIRGLGPLVATTPEEAAQRRESDDPMDRDPFAGAYSAIQKAFIQEIVELLELDGTGEEHCTMCEAANYQEGLDTVCIDSACDQELMLARACGALPSSALN
jgi:hypothetical protein